MRARVAPLVVDDPPIVIPTDHVDAAPREQLDAAIDVAAPVDHVADAERAIHALMREALYEGMSSARRRIS